MYAVNILDGFINCLSNSTLGSPNGIPVERGVRVGTQHNTTELSAEILLMFHLVSVLAIYTVAKL